MRLTLSLLFLSLSSIVGAQSSETDIRQSFEKRKAMASTSMLKNYPVRNIGPTVQGGRIVDIEVNLQNTKEYYVAYASGGIFKTTNNGITFEPVFDNNDAIGLGDFALSQNNTNVLYAGTGEKNSSRSSYAGSGVYKSTDAGKSWSYAGLAGTHHISRIAIHPQDDNIVWVAAIGALYTPNAERGVYKSTDGGKTWKKTLFINDSTGVIDLAINPKNPMQVFASAWERTRKAWHFQGNGAGTGIYRSDDGGDTWKKLENGLPTGPDVGRIGLKISAANPAMIYAVVDNQTSIPDKEDKKDEKLKLDDLRNMPKEDFLKLDDKKLDDLLKDSGFPKKYTATVVKKDVTSGKYDVKAIANYFGEDANANLFKTKIKGAEVYRSDDGGASWKKTHANDLDGVFYTYGYYFAEMEVTPTDPNLIYIYGVPLLKSRDGGATWHRIDTLKGVNDIHVDHHALWVNPNDKSHILLGNDGGLYESYDEGANWRHINNMSVGQFYTINVDMETPYNVYGGLQDNGVLKGSSKSVPNETKHWEQLFGGDGMFVSVDPKNSKLLYTGYQFGNYFRIDKETGKFTKITPQHDIGEPSLRWNWRAPMFLSSHNADIVYIAANKVFRSMDRGDNWSVISNDLTKNKNTGNVPFSTVSVLAESPRKFGLLYAGTDDGNVWISKDGGDEWESITNGLPVDKWVSSVFPSPHDEGTVYLAMNGYRDDDFNTYVFKSNDYGKTWTSLVANLPASIANVIIQDPVNKDLLYCGLDVGTFVSIDNGKNWSYMNGMLNVPAYDMIVHPRDNELVVGTHGRSVFVADVKPLQVVNIDGKMRPLMVFTPSSISHNSKWGEAQYSWDKPAMPKVDVLYYVNTPSKVTVNIFDEKDQLRKTVMLNADAGFNYFAWDARVNAAAETKKKGKKEKVTEQSEFVKKGKYKLKFSVGEETAETVVEVK